MKAKPSYREIYGNLPDPCVKLLESGPRGEELMLRVIGKAGGTCIRVPVELLATSVLVQELGRADAEAVWKIWRGASSVTVYFPRMTAALHKARRAKLMAMLASGMKVRIAARRLGITERSVYAMKAKAEALDEADTPTPQLDMFPAA